MVTSITPFFSSRRLLNSINISINKKSFPLFARVVRKFEKFSHKLVFFKISKSIFFFLKGLLKVFEKKALIHPFYYTS